MDAPIVIKVSGHELDDSTFVSEFATAVLGIAAPVIVVHGGGKEITSVQRLVGVEPVYVDGLRVTDDASMEVVEMVLCGLVNTRLVRHLVHAGVDAQGLSGVDRGLVRAAKLIHGEHDMGLTGHVVAVRAKVLSDLLRQGVTPVIAPVSLGTTPEGKSCAFNVNADHVAGAVAMAMHAKNVIFVSNVEGVMEDGHVIPVLTEAQVETMIADGRIFGGMIPKVRTALEVLDAGVPQVVITNLRGLRTHGGTTIRL